MKPVRIFTVFLFVLCLLLCHGCEENSNVSAGIFTPAKPDGSYEANLELISNNEQAGDSTYISGIRTGVHRSSLVSSQAFECTDDGVYYLALAPVDFYVDGVFYPGSNAMYLFFSPHDSDQFIKLCGRPDCTHDTYSCNAAYQFGMNNICYYNGYLYIAANDWDHQGGIVQIYRVNLDGSNRVLICSFGDRSYGGMNGAQFIDGIFTVNLVKINYETGEEVYDRFYYALDGSMAEPAISHNFYPWVNQENMDVWGIEKGDSYGFQIYSVDFRKDESEFVFDAMKYQNGYWCKEFGYTLVDGKVLKVYYEDGREELLFDTGLTDGVYFPRFFPDCIALTQRTDTTGQRPDVPMIYFYSWEGELLGELPIDFPTRVPSPDAIIGNGESKDRFYLKTVNTAGNLPTYYIEKSDFGTGKIELHLCQYPDLDEETYRNLFGFDP